MSKRGSKSPNTFGFLKHSSGKLKTQIERQAAGTQMAFGSFFLSVTMWTTLETGHVVLGDSLNNMGFNKSSHYFAAHPTSILFFK